MSIKRLVIELPDEMHQRLKEIAVTNKTHMRIVVMALIVKYLGDFAKKGKSK